MRMVSRYIIAISMVLILASCARNQLTPVDYIRHVENIDNGLRKVVVVDDWEYCIQYKPHDYILSQELKNNHDDSLWQARMQQLHGTAWFNISFKKQNSNTSPLKYGISSLADYDARYNYYLNEAVKDIALLYGADTLHPISYIFETSYNLAPVETMVVGFALTDNDSTALRDMHLVFFDRVFRNGIIKAGYNEQLLKQIPAIIR